jgi:hypothetical protein
MYEKVAENSLYKQTICDHCELSITSTQSNVYEAFGFKDPRKQNSTKHSGCAV